MGDGRDEAERDTQRAGKSWREEDGELWKRRRAATLGINRVTTLGSAVETGLSLDIIIPMETHKDKEEGRVSEEGNTTGGRRMYMDKQEGMEEVRSRSTVRYRVIALERRGMG
eukprot:TRINITY_DN2277_c0_g1_i3.p1 TRINITY_DN2277_c0_g1~~TRINITY_DN2277_c0_g1_i3.p1  ORF type:complete len:113 (-),score=11.04 TRINITY_DN2277_c0_g1_i3:359-697(-)